MHLSEIYVEDFRLFEKLSLAFNSGLNVIVGENNSGKTALIDAIRLTLDTNSSEWTRISEEDFHRDKTKFKIRLKFDSIKPEQAHVFIEHLTHEAGEAGARKSVLYVNLLAALTDKFHKGYRYIQTELKSGEHAEGPQIEREIRNYLSATYLKPLRDAEGELSAGRGSRLAQILISSKKLKESGNFEQLLRIFVQANQDAKSNLGLLDSRNDIRGYFQKLTFDEDKTKFDVLIQMLGSREFERMTEGERNNSFREILERLSISLDEGNSPQGLGYNNVLFMATELILLQQEVGQFPLLLIEEPEAHLHPQLQMKFLKFIRDEYNSLENPKLQTILTTHSPNLASKVPLDNMIVMKDGGAFPLKGGQTKLEEQDYQFLEKFLDVTKSNLFFAKGILIVEGDAENILLPTIAELLGRPLENFGVSIINVGSTAQTRYAKIFLRNGKDDSPKEWIPIKVACLRDLDLWPEKADEEICPSIGFILVKPKNKRFWIERTKSGETFGTKVADKKKWLESFSSLKDGTGGLPQDSIARMQNVRVYVSEHWTLEYCLAQKMAKHIFEAINGSDEGFNALPENEDERAIKLYGMIEAESGAKTETAYKLCEILSRKYAPTGKKEELKGKIPKYILDALEYLTGPWPENLDAIPQQAERVAPQGGDPQPPEGGGENLGTTND